MGNMEPVRAKLIKQAETVLRPSLAILLECAFEAERNSEAMEYLAGMTEHFYNCAEKGIPIRNDSYEVFDFSSSAYLEEETMYGVGLLSKDYTDLEKTIETDFDKIENTFIADEILKMDIGKLCPLVLGIGIADSEEESRRLARLALFRSPDRYSNDKEISQMERRTLSRLNRYGPGAGGLGGNSTAIAVSIEKRGSSYITLLPGDTFTRCAYQKR